MGEMLLALVPEVVGLAVSRIIAADRSPSS
ncbi:hypothetical protein FHX71_001716 [Promicromonospora sukumoe]|uniref:Uncharacterized protein n=1 Tax=Promicromonospora sukumoe TaxID=88382 RepID=A0A7W3J7U7_9MICO|nr:hypothetical protein [Promicromonospora sukumoe]